MPFEDEYDYLYKVVLIGDSSVGKSNILARLINREFCENSKSTIGVEFGLKTLKIGGKSVKAQIWDTSGQERYRAISNAYYRNASGIILVYDITNEASFNNIERWLNEIRDHSTNPVIMIIGNKLDLTAARAVATECVADFCSKHGFNYMETSAKSGAGIDEAFVAILTEVNGRDRVCEKHNVEVPKIVTKDIVDLKVVVRKDLVVVKQTSCNC